MSYEVNFYQAERLKCALDGVRQETERYLGRMAVLLGEALDEERVEGALAADALADVISEHLNDTLADVYAAVSEHFEVKNPAVFERLSGMRRAA